jgi:hypothetical protein
VWRTGLAGLAEATAVLVTALVLVTMALGTAALAGDRRGSTCPFAATVLVIGVAVALGCGWGAPRAWLVDRHAHLRSASPPASPWWRRRRRPSGLPRRCGEPPSRRRWIHRAQRTTLTIRSPPPALEPARDQAMLSARSHDPRVQADAFGVDAEVLMVSPPRSRRSGRASADGRPASFDHGAAGAAIADAKRRLGATDRRLADPRQRFLAAATLASFRRMRGVRCSPARSLGPQERRPRGHHAPIRATDFVTAQPYLKDLPRDYPVRALAAALAYRLWRADGRLPRYEEGDNARRIQAAGIPGIAADESLVSVR